MADSKIFLVFVLFLSYVTFGPVAGYGDYGNQCEDELEEIQESMKRLRTLATAVGKAVDKDFKWVPPHEKHNCPTGFTFLPEVGSCYKVVYENHNWTSAAKKCKQLNREAHLVTITSEQESDAIETFLRKDLGKNSRINVCSSYGSRNKMLWTSGQRIKAIHCDETFVWKESDESVIPFNFTKWASAEPNCDKGFEHCMHIEPIRSYRWNDISCDRLLCPLCEYESGEYEESEQNEVNLLKPA